MNLGFWGRLFIVISLSVVSFHATAQIGGQHGSSGPALIDDVEDLDLFCDGVGRWWISDYVYIGGDVLTTKSLAGSGLTLAPGQSPVGSLLAQFTPNYLYISAGFGVPVPSVKGASTLTHPGDMTSFTNMRFLGCFEPQVSNLEFQVIMECYPESSPGVYPKLHWIIQPPLGKTFGEVRFNLRTPSFMTDAGGRSVEELLSKTRFLYFYVYAGPIFIPLNQLEYYVDDIMLLPGDSAVTPTPTPTPEPTPTPTPTPEPTPKTPVSGVMLQ